MDRITKSLIEELLKVQELESEDESKDFEKLVNYTAISNEYNKTFELDFVTVGEGNDTGLDGIAIIVNGQLIESTDEVDDLIEKNGYLEVVYIFTQAKTSSNFNGGDINTFLFGIKDFFSESPRLVRNEDIQKFAELSNYVYSKAAVFRKNPDLKIYYVTTGTWTNDTNLVGVINSGKKELEEKNLFDTVTIYPFGAKELTAYYRRTKEANVATINFNKRITLPAINKISESYIGLLPFSEFKKIIVDENDKLKNVFEDNVRDFQGDANDVNQVIGGTINGRHSDLFSVLNNGVTIVADSVSPTGDAFTFRDYQIVNGCQTSNVLYNNRNSANIDQIEVPIKIIATTDEEVKNQITLATNNQTPIKKEQLAALTEFQRNLERYYGSFAGENRLYYERRSKQYNSDSSVVKTRIITIPTQIKSFSAMFLQNPHLVTSYFGTIVKRLNSDTSQIFKDDHVFVPYYTSALVYYKLETLFRKRIIDAKYKKARFHIVMLFRLLVCKDPLPPFNSMRQMEKYCKDMIDILNDDDKTIEVFKRATAVIDKVDFDLSDKQHLKLQSKTQLLITGV